MLHLRGSRTQHLIIKAGNFDPARASIHAGVDGRAQFGKGISGPATGQSGMDVSRAGPKAQPSGD